MENNWAVLELTGHVRLAGRVTEEEKFGVKLGRIDIPTVDGGFVTQYFSGPSIYRMTPVGEEAARAVAKSCQPQPVHSWELPKQLPEAAIQKVRDDFYAGSNSESDRTSQDDEETPEEDLPRF